MQRVNSVESLIKKIENYNLQADIELNHLNYKKAIQFYSFANDALDTFEKFNRFYHDKYTRQNRETLKKYSSNKLNCKKFLNFGYRVNQYKQHYKKITLFSLENKSLFFPYQQFDLFKREMDVINQSLDKVKFGSNYTTAFSLIEKIIDFKNFLTLNTYDVLSIDFNSPEENALLNILDMMQEVWLDFCID